MLQKSLLEREIILRHAHLFLFDGHPLTVVLGCWQNDSLTAGTSLIPRCSPVAFTPNPSVASSVQWLSLKYKRWKCPVYLGG